MIADLAPAIIIILAFGAVAAIVFVLGQLIETHARIRHRVGTSVQSGGAPRRSLSFDLDSLVSVYFDEKRFGVEGSARSKLRRELVRAGFFGANAINYYIFFRLASVVVVPTAVYLLTEAFLADQSWILKLALMAVALMIAILGPDAYLSRRQSKLHDKRACWIVAVPVLLLASAQPLYVVDTAFERFAAADLPMATR